MGLPLRLRLLSSSAPFPPFWQDWQTDRLPTAINNAIPATIWNCGYGMAQSKLAAPQLSSMPHRLALACGNGTSERNQSPGVDHRLLVSVENICHATWHLIKFNLMCFSGLYNACVTWVYLNWLGLLVLMYPVWLRMVLSSQGTRYILN